MPETFQLPVQVQSVHMSHPNLNVYYPRVLGLRNPIVQENINTKIFWENNLLIQQQGYYQHPSKTEVTGYYEIKTNERNVLSLSFINYAYTYQAAHGLTLIKSLTFDIKTGKSYTLKELFKPGSDYIGRISEIIKAQIKERDVPLLDEFKAIRPDQDFYIADKALVIYFQLYEITPYVYGFPMFPISVYSLQDIIAEDSPLDKMLVNN